MVYEPRRILNLFSSEQHGKYQEVKTTQTYFCLLLQKCNMTLKTIIRGIQDFYKIESF